MPTAKPCPSHTAYTRGCRCDGCRAIHSEANRRWWRSESGKASVKRYQQSPKGKAAKRRYEASPKGQAVQQARNARRRALARAEKAAA